MPIQELHSDGAEGPETPSDADELQLQDVRVLVLDDEEPVRKYLKSALSRSGCTVETADDGRTGLQVLLKQDFDVLVVDIRMSRMNGLAFIQEAKKIWPWLGIIIMTGFADDEVYDGAQKLGVTTILQKPVQLPELRAGILEQYAQTREKIDPIQKEPFSRVQYHLGLLRQLGEMAVEGDSLIQALRNLTHGIARLLPCSAVGLFDMNEDQAVCIINVQESISPASIDSIKQEMKERYEALSGNTVDMDDLRLEINGQEDASEGAPDANETIATVPILAEGHVHGILTLASTQPDAYSSADISFLYHAASQFSTVLVALSRMKNMAAHDPLTGLYNRRQLGEEMRYAWGFAERYSHAISLVMIDIDHYKEINDQYGHLVGDEILKDFSDLLQSVARSSDILGRYGGDEFVAVLQQSSMQDSFTFCTRLLHAAREHVFCPGTHDIHITLSIGMANNYSEKAPAGLEELIDQADQALYMSKREGRNRISIWNSNVETDADAVSLPDRRKGDRLPETSSHTRMLVVDDDPSIGRLIQRMLDKQPFSIDVSHQAADAREKVQSAKSQYDVLMIDLNLSEESGFDILEEMHAIDPSVVNVVISGEATVDNAVASLRFGAYDFVEKPLTRENVQAVLDRAVEYRRLMQENRRYQLYLEDIVQEKSQTLMRTMQQLQRSYQFTLEAMVRMLDAREKTTGEHSLRVQRLASIISERMNLSDDQKEAIARGALLHDIGKIAIPDSILLKPGPLNDEEWDIMKTHAEIGYSVIRQNPDLAEVAEIVHSHHERFDGSGYPRGIQGETICLGARIFALVDAYDAMRSDRVYRKSISPDDTREEILRCKGTHFDPRIVDLFIECQQEFEDVGRWAFAAPQQPAFVSSDN